MATETPTEWFAKALKAREGRLTPEQAQRRREVDERNQAIQETKLGRMKFGCPKDKT